MGQPTQRATNYTARSNIDTAQIFLHANGQRPKRAMIRQRSRRRQRRGEPHTEHGLGVLLAFHTHTAASMKRDRRKSLYMLTKFSHYSLCDVSRQCVPICRRSPISSPRPTIIHICLPDGLPTYFIVFPTRVFCKKAMQYVCILYCLTTLCVVFSVSCKKAMRSNLSTLLYFLRHGRP